MVLMLVVISIVVYLGYIIGNFLAYPIKEELKQVNLPLMIFQKVLFLVSLIAVLIMTSTPYWVVIIAIILLIFSFFYKQILPSKLIYPLYGLILVLVSQNKYFFFIFSALVFLFGIASGTLDRTGKGFKIEKGVKKDILVNLIFFIAIIVHIILLSLLQ